VIKVTGGIAKVFKIFTAQEIEKVPDRFIGHREEQVIIRDSFKFV
jgi:hypothetical protein